VERAGVAIIAELDATEVGLDDLAEHSLSAPHDDQLTDSE